MAVAWNGCRVSTVRVFGTRAEYSKLMENLTRDHVLLIVLVAALAFCAWGYVKHQTCPRCQNKAAAMYQMSALQKYGS